MSAESFIITIDVEYVVENRATLEAATHGADVRPNDLSDRVAHLLERKFEERALDVDGARVVGHSLTLPG